VSSGAAIAVTVLTAYTLTSAVFAFNLWRLSDRAARAFVGKPWFVRAIGRENPNSWRAGGTIGLAFGVLVLGWIALQAVK
jgi:predicted branched-subunit amino acid permease